MCPNLAPSFQVRCRAAWSKCRDMLNSLKESMNVSLSPAPDTKNCPLSAQSSRTLLFPDVTSAAFFVSALFQTCTVFTPLHNPTFLSSEHFHLVLVEFDFTWCILWQRKVLSTTLRLHSSGTIGWLRTTVARASCYLAILCRSEH